MDVVDDAESGFAHIEVEGPAGIQVNTSSRQLGVPANHRRA